MQCRDTQTHPPVPTAARAVLPSCPGQAGSSPTPPSLFLTGIQCALCTQGQSGNEFSLLRSSYQGPVLALGRCKSCQCSCAQVHLAAKLSSYHLEPCKCVIGKVRGENASTLRHSISHFMFSVSVHCCGPGVAVLFCHKKIQRTQTVVSSSSFPC